MIFSKMRNKVSIIVPIYGVEKYIERCARSLFEQSFKDIEYIFVNDCTTDASMSILASVIRDYPGYNIHIINKKTNEGLPQARKTGVIASTGEYIMHVDSDDWLEPKAIEKLYLMAIEKKQIWSAVIGLRNMVTEVLFVISCLCQHQTTIEAYYNLGLLRLHGIDLQSEKCMMALNSQNFICLRIMLLHLNLF